MKAMYFSYQPYFINIANNMFEKCNWIPAYWSVVPETEKTIKKLYPNAICHNHFDAIKGIPPKEFEGLNLDPLCPNILLTLSKHERIVLNMLDRNDAYTNSFAYKDRFELYRYFVQYWMTILKKISPNYVVFEEEPHQANDYVLYIVCKLLNIKTIMFVQTIFYPHMFPLEEFEKGSELIFKKYKERLSIRNNKKIKLSSSMENYFKIVKSDYNSAVAIHHLTQSDEINRIYQNGIKIIEPIKNFIALFKWQDMKDRWSLITKPNTFYSDQKQMGKAFKDSKLTYIGYLFYKLNTIHKKRKLRHYYKKISTYKPPKDCKFIFLALNYQPEKTTSPLGGVFADQLYCIELLSKVMPKDWVLIVKDHPSQFVSSYSRYGENQRSYAYYDKISSYKNVHMISLDQDPFYLIDRAQAVAAVTGTVAWEAVVRGVPAMVFGHPWFKNCEGIFYTSTINEIIQFLKLIQGGYVVDEKKVKIFADVVEKESFKAIIGGQRVGKFFDITLTENANSHVKAIEHLLDLKK